jgi:transposase-like protein
MMAERSVKVAHSTILRWVTRYGLTVHSVQKVTI